MLTLSLTFELNYFVSSFLSGTNVQVKGYKSTGTGDSLITLSGHIDQAVSRHQVAVLVKRCSQTRWLDTNNWEQWDEIDFEISTYRAQMGAGGPLLR